MIRPKIIFLLCLKSRFPLHYYYFYYYYCYNLKIQNKFFVHVSIVRKQTVFVSKTIFYRCRGRRSQGEFLPCLIYMQIVETQNPPWKIIPCTPSLITKAQKKRKLKYEIPNTRSERRDFNPRSPFAIESNRGEKFHPTGLKV